MASDGPSPHFPSLRLGLPAPQPWRRHHAQSLLGPSFHDPRTHHVLECRRSYLIFHLDSNKQVSSSSSHLEQAAPLSLRDDERRHTIVSIVSPHSPSLCLGLPAPPTSRHHHAQSLLGPSFHDPRTHHVLESHPEQAAPLSLRDDERRHAIRSHSVLALRLYLAACSPSSSCDF